MKLIETLFGIKCAECRQKIKGERFPALGPGWMCQLCYSKVEEDRRRQDEERKNKEAEQKRNQLDAHTPISAMSKNRARRVIRQAMKRERKEQEGQVFPSFDEIKKQHHERTKKGPYTGRSVTEMVHILRDEVRWGEANQHRFYDLDSEFKERRKVIVQIGEELDRRGGIKLMREVYKDIPGTRTWT